MYNTIMWFYLAIAAALGWAIGSIFLKRSYRFFSSSQVYLFNSISFLFLWLIYNWINHASFVFPSQKLLVFLPALPALAFIIFINALKQGRVSIISAIISTSPLISTVLAILFLRERISLIQLILIVFIVIAIIVIQVENNQESFKEKVSIINELVLGLLTAIAFAIANTANKSVINQIGPANFSLINAHWMIIISLIWLVTEKQQHQWKLLATKEGTKLTLGSLIYNFGSLFFFSALDNAPLSLVIPITNLSTPLTLILATIFLKEKTTRIQKISIFAIFLAATILKITG